MSTDTADGRQANGDDAQSGGDRPDAAGDGDPTGDRLDLEARLELLREENRRLRSEYARARRAQYRRTAVALLLVGAVGVAGAVLFPGARTVLLALGGTGVFAGVLTYYLTPERLVPASVGESVFAAGAANVEALAADLGLSSTRVYAPVAADTARLFVPQHADFDLPAPDALAPGLVVTDAETERGLALEPAADALFEAFETALTGPIEDVPGPLGEQLADALVEQFELVESATAESDGAGGVTVAVTDPTYAGVGRTDHPVVSFLATGAALGLGEPVTASVDTDRSRYDAVVTVSPLRGDAEPEDSVESEDGAEPVDGVEPEETDARPPEPEEGSGTPDAVSDDPPAGG